MNYCYTVASMDQEPIVIEAVIDGVSYRVLHCFTTERVILDYEGLVVLADQAPDGTWELSGVPATDEERPILKRFTDPMLDQTIVKVTPPTE